MGVLRHLLRFYRPYRWYLIGAFAAMTGVITLGLLQPRVIGYFTDRVLVGGDHDLVLPLTGLLLAIALTRGLLGFTQHYLQERFGIKSVYDLRNGLYTSLQQLSFGFYDKAHTGDLMSRVTADVEAIRHFLSNGPSGLANFALGITLGIGMGFWVSWRLTLITLIAAPVLAYLILRFSRLSQEKHAATRRAVAGLATVIQEAISGIRTIKAYAREDLQEQRFTAKNQGFAAAHNDAAMLWARYFPLLELWAQLSAALVITYGGYLAATGVVSLGEYVAYLGIQWNIINPLWNVGGHVNNYTQAQAAGQRLVELLYRPRGIQDGPGALPLPQMAGHLRFEGVAFHYGDEVPVLEEINIDAPPGSVIGILGPTGAGKSTLLSLIPRFYDATAGRVTVDGHDVRQLKLADLRRQVGIVFQEIFLFSATIRSNIAYGRPEAAWAEIEEAARLANIHEFIASLPQGYDTVVGERGLGLSGGQKQRIAIARAILNNPRILILDDATAAVDAETESEIQKALRTVMQGRTTFIVGHRISAVRRADEILVLEGNRIAERGGHEELLQRGGLYSRIFAVQYADGEEVAS